MNRGIFTGMVLFLSGIMQAQEPVLMDLQDCIETAIKNNLSIRQRELNRESARVNYNQARTNLLPNVNGIAAHGINQGRSIDPFTNSYVNQNINYANYGLSSSVILFNGMSLQNTVRSNAYAFEASGMELQGEKDNLSLNVMFAYLQVLNNEEILDLSIKQAEVSQRQVERLDILNRQGAINPPQYHDLVGQWKDNELAVVNTRNQLYLSKLLLTQLMNIPYDSTLKLERVGMEELLQAPEGSASQVYAKASESLAVIRAADLRSKSAMKALKAVRGQLYPTIYLAGNLSTNYSSVATRELVQQVNDVPTSAYVTVNGSKVPVIVQQYGSEKIPYNSQVRNNVFSNIEAGIRIPLFNSFLSRNRIKLAGIDVKSAELAEEAVKVQLRQDIEQAELNRKNAWERYRVLLDQVTAYTESFKAAEVRFNAGVGTSVDYLIAKNNLDRASANLVIARYDYLLRKRVLDFYAGMGIGK